MHVEYFKIHKNGSDSRMPLLVSNSSFDARSLPWRRPPLGPSQPQSEAQRHLCRGPCARAQDFGLPSGSLFGSVTEN